MHGLMQDVPLLISSLIEHADRHHGAVELVSRRVEGDLHRTTYRQLHARAKQLANGLDAWGVGTDQRVATWRGTAIGT
jgi:fatty-acyl-CoA synthase